MIRPDDAAHERLQRQLAAWCWFFRSHIGLSVAVAVCGLVIGSWLLIGMAVLFAAGSAAWLVWYRRYRQRTAALKREREGLFWESIQDHLNAEAWGRVATRGQNEQEGHEHG